MKYTFDNTDLIKTYEYLHTIPELAFMEEKTSAYIVDFLKNINLNPVISAKTGVYADIKGNGKSNKMLLLRADIDGLPVTEESDVDFPSVHKGQMHACGHDMHTTCLLYAAKALCENRDKFSGIVRVVFQPAEEGEGGALPMIEEGITKGATAALAMHVDPLEPTGTLVYKNGGITASPDHYYITITGIGGHGAEPEKCINPLIAAAEIIHKYSNLKNDYFKERECVISVCSCNGGTFSNIIPDVVEISGTARSLDPETRKLIKEKIINIAENTAKNTNTIIECKYEELYPPCINSPEMNEFLIKAAKRTDGILSIKELSKSYMIGDDFAYFAEECPGCYFRFGTAGESDERFPLHSSKFKIDEKSLLIACKLIVNTAMEYFN